MAERPSSQPSSSVSQRARAAEIERLRTVPCIQQLSLTGLRVVTSIRLLAICGRLGRDPLLELTQRFSCITTAKASIDFADAVGACWPENVRVMRPCCSILTPDETTLAQVMDAAAAGDRALASRVLDGFVRADRHDRLYDRAAKLAALMH